MMKENVLQPQHAPPSSALSVGDIAPSWVFTKSDGSHFSLGSDSIAGSPLVIFFSLGVDALQSKASALFASSADAFCRLGARIVTVVRDRPASPTAAGLPSPVIVDSSALFSNGLGEPMAPLTVVLRRNGHVAGIFTGDVQSQIEGTLALLTQLDAEDSELVATHAHHPPVLLVPDVLSRDDCRYLLEVFETRGQIYLQETEALDYIGTDYKMRIPEHMREDRVDHFFFDQDVVAFLDRRLQRVLPEIFKAFQYRITKYESLRMACYEGARLGLGHGHRDNIPPHLHRRFAMSINLNSEEFEGGELVFPEFGNRRYRPPTGAAIVFSSSLLHEALQVTKGRRFVFLAFLFGET